MMIPELKCFNDSLWATEQTCGPERWRNLTPLSLFGAADIRSSWARWKTKVSGDNDPTTPCTNNKLLRQPSAKKHARHADHQIAQGSGSRHTALCAVLPGNKTKLHHCIPCWPHRGTNFCWLLCLTALVSLCLLLVISSGLSCCCGFPASFHSLEVDWGFESSLNKECNPSPALLG